MQACKLPPFALLFTMRRTHFRALLIGFTTPEIYRFEKEKERNIHAATSSPFEIDKLHFYEAEIERRSNFFIPGEYAGIKIFTASVYPQIIYFPFYLLYVILYFPLVLNHHQSRLDVGIFNR